MEIPVVGTNVYTWRVAGFERKFFSNFSPPMFFFSTFFGKRVSRIVINNEGNNDIVPFD